MENEHDPKVYIRNSEDAYALVHAILRPRGGRPVILRLPFRYRDIISRRVIARYSTRRSQLFQFDDRYRTVLSYVKFQRSNKVASDRIRAPCLVVNSNHRCVENNFGTERRNVMLCVNYIKNRIHRGVYAISTRNPDSKGALSEGLNR